MDRTLPLLSKSRYLAGLQCEKRLYLECFRRDLMMEVSDADRRVMQQGTDVGILATQRYPGGLALDPDPRVLDRAVQATARAMIDPSVPAIFEAAFCHDGVRVRVDILARRRYGWRLEEVKSSTTVEDVHVDDVAVQLHTLRKAGVDVREAGILHLDRAYVRRAGGLDLSRLFTYEDLLAQADACQRDVARNLTRFRSVLAAGRAPAVAAGRHCGDPYGCPFLNHCAKPVGRFSLQRLPAAAKLIEALPGGTPDDVRRLPLGTKLTALQKRAVGCLRRQREHVGQGLAPALDDIAYPIHFLDFETFMPAVPPYVGTRVYQTLPVQWSDHVLAADGTLTHHEFLHTEDSDPRASFAASLLETLGEGGTIVVYTSYEATQIRALAEELPRWRRGLARIGRRMLDLHKVVRAQYYHPALDGSFSLKAIAPVLAPHVEYAEIGNGTEAVAAYEEMIAPSTPAARRDELGAQLRHYCQIDTLAMVEIRRALLERTAVASSEKEAPVAGAINR